MTGGRTGVTEWDFFLSYQQEDRAWAEWIAWQLEAAGYSVLFQLWDFVPGMNWVKRVQDGVNHSARVIAVLSDAYLSSAFGAAEWQAIWAHDPDGAERRVITIRVVDCERPGLLVGIVGIDLFGVTESKAMERLQNAIQRALSGTAKPLERPVFPVATAVAGDTGPNSSASAEGTSVPPAVPNRDADRPRFPERHLQGEVRGAPRPACRGAGGGRTRD